MLWSLDYKCYDNVPTVALSAVNLLPGIKYEDLHFP